MIGNGDILHKKSFVKNAIMGFFFSRFNIKKLSSSNLNKTTISGNGLVQC